MSSLFSEDFMPHGHCYLWKPEILWLNAISDGVIFLAYMTIPFILIYIIAKTQNKVPFNLLFVLFSLFILACGTTHLLEVVNIWRSEYFIAGLVKAFTAIVSVLTVFALFPYVPKIIKQIERK